MTRANDKAGYVVICNFSSQHLFPPPDASDPIRSRSDYETLGVCHRRSDVGGGGKKWREGQEK